MTKEKTKKEFRRVNINVPADLVERVKEYGENIGINTTSAYIVLLNQALDSKQSMTSLPQIISMYNEFKAMENQMDEE